MHHDNEYAKLDPLKFFIILQALYLNHAEKIYLIFFEIKINVSLFKLLRCETAEI